MARQTIKSRIWLSFANSRDSVILRRELKGFGDPSQVTRAIQELIREGRIVRVGYGLFTKARKSTITGQAVPAFSLSQIGSEFLKKNGVDPQPGRAARAYNAGVTTQIPMKTVFYTSGRRVSRKIQIGNSLLEYEATF